MERPKREKNSGESHSNSIPALVPCVHNRCALRHRNRNIPHGRTQAREGKSHMRMRGLSHTVLMEESESRIANLAREGSATQALVARRVLEDTRLYRHWEAEH